MREAQRQWCVSQGGEPWEDAEGHGWCQFDDGGGQVQQVYVGAETDDLPVTPTLPEVEITTSPFPWAMFFALLAVVLFSRRRA